MSRNIAPHDTPVTRSSWLARYFDRSRPNGLYRTLVYAAVGICLILFCILVVLVHHATKGALWDQRLQSDAYSIRSSGLTRFFWHISELASVAGLAVLFMAAAAQLYRRQRTLVAVLFVAIALDGLVTEIVKQAVARARPMPALALVHETSYSFPSGHTMAAVLCWGVVAYFVVRSCRRTWQRWLVVLLYMLGIAAVASSRIYLGAHYFSDVAGSILLGWGLLGLFLSWLAGQPKHLPADLFNHNVPRAFGIAFVILVTLSLLLPGLFS